MSARLPIVGIELLPLRSEQPGSRASTVVEFSFHLVLHRLQFVHKFLTRYVLRSGPTACAKSLEGSALGICDSVSCRIHYSIVSLLT